MKIFIFYIAKYTGLFALSRYLTRNMLRILAYHGVWMGSGHYGNYLYMSVDKFSARMKYLKQSSYRLLSLQDAVTGLKQKNLPACPVAITIDDGWYSTYQYMLPCLEKYEIPATLYLTTYYCNKQVPVPNVCIQYLFSCTKKTSIDLTDLGILIVTRNGNNLNNNSLSSKADYICDYVNSLNDEDDKQHFLHQLARYLEVDLERIVNDRLFHLMNIPEMRDASKRGMDVQLHTHRHRVSKDGKDCLAKEICDNRNNLSMHLHHPLIHFCYPSGEFESSMWTSLTELGVESATTTKTGLVTHNTNLLALPRILDGEKVPLIEFEAELAGFCEILRKVRKIIQERHL